MGEFFSKTNCNLLIKKSINPKHLSIGKYTNEDIILELPGEKTVFEIDWLAVWNEKLQINYGSVIIPSALNIPPIITNFIKYDSVFPNCQQLHQKLQMNWEIFGPQITFESRKLGIT